MQSKGLQTELVAKGQGEILSTRSVKGLRCLAMLSRDADGRGDCVGLGDEMHTGGKSRQHLGRTV